MMGAEKVENGIASVSAPAARIEKKGVAEMSDLEGAGLESAESRP